MNNPCGICNEYDGIHELSVVESGGSEPLGSIWLCKLCYLYIKLPNKPDIRRRWELKPTIIDEPLMQPLELPPSMPTPKFIGDKPLPDVHA